MIEQEVNEGPIEVFGRDVTVELVGQKTALELFGPRPPQHDPENPNRVIPLPNSQLADMQRRAAELYGGHKDPSWMPDWFVVSPQSVRNVLRLVVHVSSAEQGPRAQIRQTKSTHGYFEFMFGADGITNLVKQ
jgi:hypothetical protein